MIVYLITNTMNNKQYVGQTTYSIEHRWSGHCTDSKRTNMPIGNAIRKYGKQSFTIEQIYEATCQEDLDYAEEYFIKAHNTLKPNGYNLRTGGQGGRLAEETKLKIGNASRGRRHTDEAKAKMSRARLGVSKPKTSATLKAKWQTEEFRQKCLAGQKPSPLKKLVIDDTGFIYDSVTLVARAYDTSPSAVRGKIKRTAEGRPSINRGKLPSLFFL